MVVTYLLVDVMVDDDLSVVVGFGVVLGFEVVDIGGVDFGVVDFGVVDFGVVDIDVVDFGVVDFGVVVAVLEEEFEEVLAEILVDWLDNFVTSAALVDWLVNAANTVVLVD